ncbi:DNA cytosine methyltransferase [Tenacibaculum maritimum]|uniref:DNA cytosine methyltransferase n=1 Tax=Tenacibaculum maritimum TaxID=107401 RepID=UPI0012E52546|nr:DNA (cytosine-5-)-methyltransferase [Tenacibaculum maritimum]CAA0234341.1 Modification methylase ScrFIA [Tenacibaculum maritimum]CAA0245330.1 Modification methylase ScrFIA [Tenacibaculum maritimum]
MSRKIKYSKIREFLNVENMNGEAEDIAYFTHFLQDNSDASTYQKRANKYYQIINENKLISKEPDVQYLLPLNWNINFPRPETPTFKFIDLFAGIGGFRLGAQQNNGKCVFSSEWDKFAQQTYEYNFGEVPFGDITKIDTQLIPEHDILFAGFPCQPFSYSGRNEGFKDKTRGTLFFDILRILEQKKPKMFLLENVKGLKSHNKGKTLETIEESLKKLGYNIRWEILKSTDFGLPQMRERWYCVGSLENFDFKFPTKTKTDVTLKSIIDPNENSEKLRLTDFELSRIQHHFKNVSDEYERVEHDSSKYEPNTKKGKHGIYSFQKKDGSLRFHVGDHAKTQIQEAFYCTLESYSPTIIANRVPKLWDIERKLSVLEAQRLQGFPDKFDFPVSDNQAYKQLGNSVSVPVVELIIKEMIKHL